MSIGGRATMIQRQAPYTTTQAFPEPNYTQTPNNFFDMLPDMEASEITVTLIMIRNTFGFHRSNFKMGISKLEKATGLSRNAVKAGAEAAENRGTFRRVNPDEQSEAEWELVVGQSVTPLNEVPPLGQSVTLDRSSIDSQVRVKESKETSKEFNIKGAEIPNDLTAKFYTDQGLEVPADLLLAEIKKRNPPVGIEAKMLAGLPTDDSDLNPVLALEASAIEAFERAFGIESKWSWYPAKTTDEKVWKEFRLYLVKLHQADPECFTKYFEWASDKYARGAMTGLKIKRNPQDFPDSWAAYKASMMYGRKQTDEERPEYKPFPFLQGTTP